MSKKNQPRVMLGEPYNKIYYWNTAVKILKILNNYYRGKYDTLFRRNNNPPYHATSSSTAVCIGGIGTDQVIVAKALLNDMVIQTKEAKRAED